MMACGGEWGLRDKLPDIEQDRAAYKEQYERQHAQTEFPGVGAPAHLDLHVSVIEQVGLALAFVIELYFFVILFCRFSVHTLITFYTGLWVQSKQDFDRSCLSWHTACTHRYARDARPVADSREQHNKWENRQ
jgi:hypothetical protein